VTPAAPTASQPARSGRRLAVVVLCGVLGAALVAIAAALTWWSADYTDPLTGPLTVALAGGSVVPELVPLTLVGLAGLGASLATGGVPRRLVGLVLVACGVTVTVRSVLAFTAGPDGPAALAGSLTRPADPVGAAQLHPVGPLLAVIGGVLLGVAGLLVVLGVGARRLGARYERTARPGQARTERDAALEQADWWKALDAGADPTAADPTAADPNFAEGTVADSIPAGGTPIPVTDGDDDHPGRSASRRVGRTGTDVGTPPAVDSVTGSGMNPTRPDTAGRSTEGSVSEQTSGGGYDDAQATRPRSGAPE
jgi:uncharacterized membrane protein (TIGR02234 family)